MTNIEHANFAFNKKLEKQLHSLGLLKDGSHAYAVYKFDVNEEACDLHPYAVSDETEIGLFIHKDDALKMFESESLRSSLSFIEGLSLLEYVLTWDPSKKAFRVQQLEYLEDYRPGYGVRSEYEKSDRYRTAKRLEGI